MSTTIISIKPIDRSRPATSLGELHNMQAIFKDIFNPGAARPSKVLKEIGVLQGAQSRKFTLDGRGNAEIWKPEHEEFNGDPGYWETIWGSISHNERVDRGAGLQSYLVFGTVTGASQAPAGTLKNIAIANAAVTATKTHEALNSVSAPPQNEFSTVGLSRAAGTIQNYVAPASLGAVFSVDIYKLFTVSGAGGTATGSGLFDSATASGSFMYVEAPFGSNAVLVAADTLAVTWTISN